MTLEWGCSSNYRRTSLGSPFFFAAGSQGAARIDKKTDQNKENKSDNTVEQQQPYNNNKDNNKNTTKTTAATTKQNKNNHKTQTVGLLLQGAQPHSIIFLLIKESKYLCNAYYIWFFFLNFLASFILFHTINLMYYFLEKRTTTVHLLSFFIFKHYKQRSCHKGNIRKYHPNRSQEMHCLATVAEQKLPKQLVSKNEKKVHIKRYMVKV